MGIFNQFFENPCLLQTPYFTMMCKILLKNIYVKMVLDRAGARLCFNFYTLKLYIKGGERGGGAEIRQNSPFSENLTYQMEINITMLPVHKRDRFVL